MRYLLFILIVQLFSPITIISLPEGDLHWSTTKPKNARFCVPAAFSTESGKIINSYKYSASIEGDTFILTTNHRTKNSFSQLTLVKNSKATKFKDPKRSIRRALCKKSGKTFIIQSKIPMTLSQFAKYCSRFSTDAINLDMGSYGYGYCNGINLAPWAIFWKNKQTNWIYIN